jgi:ATP-binding cassette subfamily B protein
VPAITHAARSLEFARPQRRRLVAVVALALVLAAASALDPLILKYLFDQLGSPDGLEAFATGLAALAVLEVTRATLQGIMGVWSWDARLAVEFELRDRVVSKLNRLPLSFHQREGVGGTMTRVNQAIASWVAAFGDATFNLVPTLLYLVLSIATMVQLDLRLALLVVVFAPLPAIIGARAAPEQIRRERRLVERWTSIYSRFNEVLAGMMTVKGFGMEDAEKHRFLQGVRKGNEVVRRGVRRDSLNGGLRTLAVTSARLAALGLGGYLAVRGEITIGTLVAFLGYIGGLFGPVQGLTNTYQTLRKATVALEARCGPHGPAG